MELIDNRVGEPDLSFIPEHLLPGKLPKELHQFFEFGYSIDRQGIPETLQAVTNYFNSYNNLTGANAAKPDQIVMADGARAAASVAIIYIKRKFAKLAPRVLLLKPGYNLYDNQFSDLGFELDSVVIDPKSFDEAKIEIIRKHLTDDTLILPITNPNNPTGEIYSKKFMESLLRLIDDFPNLHIISDSVYDHIIRSGSARPTNIYALAKPEERNRVFEINGLAKGYAYPAIRVGWVISSEETAQEMQEIKDPMLGPLNNIAQIVAIAALKYTKILVPNYREKVLKEYDSRLKLVHDALHKIPDFKSEMPAGAFYYWADFSGTKFRAEEIVKKLEKKNIFLSWGKKFGSPSCIRINCGAKPEILTKICDAVVELCQEGNI